MDHGFGNFLRRVNILFEVGPHGGDTLVNAAPSLDDRLLVLRFVLLEGKWRLADGKHLLVLHILASVSRLQNCLAVVLYLGLWALSCVSVLEVDRAGNFQWQNELEADRVAARLKATALNRENWLLVMSEKVLVLNALRVLDGAGWVIVSLSGPESGEGAFLFALDFDFDARCEARLHNVEVDFTVDGVSGLVEGELCLDLDSALGVVGSRVAEDVDVQ